MAASNKKTIVLGLDYSQFDGGVTEVNRKMGLLDAEFKYASESAKKFGDETTQLTLKQDQLTRKINLQTRRVQLAQEAYDKAWKSGTASEATIDKLDKALLNQRTTLEKLKNELSEVDKNIENANKSGESFGDSLRNMASTLGIEISPALEGLASKFDGVNKHVGNAVLGIGALITTFAGLSLSAANMADDLLTLSTVTGVSTDELQKMQYASKFLDVEVETMTGAMTKLTRSMDAARDGTKDQEEAFSKLHLKYKDTSGQLLDVNDVFYKTIDALGRVKNETERDALAMTLMGKSAKELNPLIEAGSQRLKELGVEAENMGTVMDENSLDKLGRLKDAMDKLENTSGALKDTLGLELAPMLTALFETIGKIPVPVLQTLVVLGTVITTIVLIVKAIKSVTGTAGEIAKFFSNINPGAIKTTAIIIGVVAALIALGTIIAVIIGKSQELQASIDSVGTSVGQVTNAVTGAQQTATNAVNNSNVVLKRSELGNSYYAPDLRAQPYAGRNFAGGTDYYPGGKAWVNEGGPEIIELPRGSRIYSNEESKNMLGGDNYYFNFNVNANDINEIQKLINTLNGLKQSARQGKLKPG